MGKSGWGPFGFLNSAIFTAHFLLVFLWAVRSFERAYQAKTGYISLCPDIASTKHLTWESLGNADLVLAAPPSTRRRTLYWDRKAVSISSPNHA